MNAKASSESGQIMVLLALAFVGLLGFAALAIDTGMVYTDRRNDQNAADAAALAGMQQTMQIVKSVTIANFQCDTSGNWVTSTSTGWGSRTAPAWLTQSVLNATFQKAITTAQKNGIVLEVGLANKNGVAFRCGKDNNVSFLELRVEVSSTPKTSFVHFFYGGKVRNTVEAVSYGKPTQPYAAGYAMYSMDPSCSAGGIDMNGGGKADPNVRIIGAGAFSRSCMESSGHGSIFSDTTNTCLDNPAHPGWCNTQDPNFTPTINRIYTDPFIGMIDEPNCNDRTIAPARTYSGPEMEPGYYGPSNFGGSNSTKIDGHDNYKLKPGLYCFDIGPSSNARLALNGGGSIVSIAGNGYLEGVTIVMVSGSLDASGGGGMNLKASLPNQTGYAPNIVPGLVLMAASSSRNSDLVTGGNSGTDLLGTVYFPKGKIDLGGNASQNGALSTQFIALTFRHHGTATSVVNYNSEYLVQAKPSISLRK